MQLKPVAAYFLHAMHVFFVLENVSNIFRKKYLWNKFLHLKQNLKTKTAINKAAVETAAPKALHLKRFNKQIYHFRQINSE